MSQLYFVDRLLKVVRERRTVVSEAITEGSVQDFAAFRHLRGKLEVWTEVEREIRLLLKQDTFADESDPT